MTRSEEIALKLKLARRFLHAHKLSGVFLTRRNNFAWITAGGDNHVSLGQAEGTATVFLGGRKVYAIANNIEAARLLSEELPPDFELLDFAWHEPAGREKILRRLAKGRVASDIPLFKFPLLSEDWNALRYSLLPSELKRYRALAQEAAVALEAAALAVKPGMTEHEVAADLAWLCTQWGLDPLVRLVAADERIRNFRHPIPTEKKIRKTCLLVLCAERRGLVAAASRLIHFGKLPRDLSRRHLAVCKVDAAMISASRVGASFGEVFRVAQRTYRELGFAGEWRCHHQGGPTGYATREFVANAQEKRFIQPNQPIAWNPSIAGTKSEDTILATAAGPQILTFTGHWPMLKIQGSGQTILRPAILEK
ncbi:MAG: hypothetical protein A2V67_08495 [Deltaproteobacteria bacterium RBG_13_61_14]|nr:MAG: hypothetical protein A2V67_08495 [Deltaproteobacteria bacterium RBG_13_61_14]